VKINDDAVHFLGLKVHPLTMEQSIQRCEDLIKLRGKQHVVINAAKVVSASESPELQEIIASCDLINADGMSIVWASRLLGVPVPERVAGIDLMHSLVELSRDKNYSIHLLGANESVSRRVAKTFSEFGANVIGRRNGYWEKEEEAGIVQEIASLAPDILLVAIPSPNKEHFLREHLKNLNCGLVVGVGGSFDVVAGVTKRAPKLLQSLGLEWFYRLSQEPRRMIKRYAVGNTKFILLVLSALVSSRKRNRKI
jgi:N-acetylglucosaminyldiphosphoundecaprenol N-acetyl-beta-D-mannosaminyltransferase